MGLGELRMVNRVDGIDIDTQKGTVERGDDLFSLKTRSQTLVKTGTNNTNQKLRDEENWKLSCDRGPQRSI